MGETLRGTQSFWCLLQSQRETKDERAFMFGAIRAQQHLFGRWLQEEIQGAH